MNSKNGETITIDALKDLDTRKAVIFIIGLSAVAIIFLFWLLYFQEPPEETYNFVEWLPGLNATLNGIATIFLILGFVAIKQMEFARHMRYMIAAFVASTFFLVSYVIYHNFVGHTPFPGEGLIRPVYFFILITHIILSVAVVPLVLSSFYFSLSGKLQTHRKISKITFPVWLYVSVTGVMIYFILNAYT